MQFLQRMGEEVVTVTLSTQEQVCNQTDCLLRLAERYQAQRLVGGEITANDKNYLIQVWIYDRATAQPTLTEARCNECSSEQLYDTTGRTAGQLLEAPQGGQPAGVGAIPGGAAEPAQPVAPTVAEPTCRPRYQTFARGVALGSLASLTLASWVTAFTYMGYNGKTYAQRADGNGDITLDFGWQYRLALGLSALPAVGAIAAALPWHDVLSPAHPGRELPRCREAGSGRWTFRRGLAIGSLGAMTLAGFVTSFALTGMNGHVYAYSDNGAAITYNLKTHYSVGYSLSAAALAGLGLSIALP